MPDLGEFRLGIIGGCLSHQAGIPHSVLYHRVLDRKLQDENQIRLKVSIARFFDRDYKQRLDALLEETQVDGVLLHLRVVFTAKSAFLVNRLVDGKRYYNLHPFLFHQNETGWNRYITSNPKGQKVFSSKEPQKPTLVDEDPFDRPTPSKKIFGFRLRSLNLAVGAWTGLDDWAISDEFSMFDEFSLNCRQRGIPFFILGPTPIKTYPAETSLWRKMNKKIGFEFSRSGIPFCLLEQFTDENGNPLLLGDGFHLNEFGHTYVAQKLHLTMTPWIKEILQK